MKTETKLGIAFIGIFIAVVTISTLRNYEHQQIKQKQQEQILADAKTVYNWHYTQCEKGMEMLKNYANALERKGIDINRCCKQRATECINRSNIDKIQRISHLIHSGFSVTYIMDEFSCELPADFCLYTNIIPGDIELKSVR